MRNKKILLLSLALLGVVGTSIGIAKTNVNKKAEAAVGDSVTVTLYDYSYEMFNGVSEDTWIDRKIDNTEEVVSYKTVGITEGSSNGVTFTGLALGTNTSTSLYISFKISEFYTLSEIKFTHGQSGGRTYFVSNTATDTIDSKYGKIQVKGSHKDEGVNTNLSIVDNMVPGGDTIYYFNVNGGSSTISKLEFVLKQTAEIKTKYNVTYWSNDGEEEYLDFKEVVAEGEKPKNNPIPNHVDGQNFKGWSETINGNISVNPTELTINDDKKFYAIWEKVLTHTVEIYDYIGSEVKTQTYNDGEMLNLEDPTPRDGFKFEGWYTSDKFEEETKVESNYVVKGDLTVYGKWISTVGVQMAFNGVSFKEQEVEKNFVTLFDKADLSDGWSTTSTDTFSNSVDNGYNGSTHAMKLCKSGSGTGEASVIYEPTAPIKSLTKISIYASFDKCDGKEEQFTIKINDNKEYSLNLTGGKNKQTVVNNSIQIQEENITKIEINNKVSSSGTTYINAVILNGTFKDTVASFENTNSSLRFSSRVLAKDLEGKEDVTVKTNYEITDVTLDAPKTGSEEKQITLADKTLVDNQYYEFDFVVFNIPFEHVDSMIKVSFEIDGKKTEERTISVKEAVQNYLDNAETLELSQDDINLLTLFSNAK